MNKTLRIILWLVLLNLPRQVWAIDSCFQCVPGIWDDPALSSNLGEIVVGQPKDIYVGIEFAEGLNEFGGVQFSIAGLSNLLVLEWEPIIPPPAIAIENVQAPADASMSSSGVGGVTVAWHDCLVGNQALIRVRVLASSDITNGLLLVKRHYPPPTYPARTPLFYQCSNPLYTPTRVKGGYYILNWNGDPSVRVGGATWSMVKQLYR